MAQQPSWRGHRAPVEDPGSPGAWRETAPQRRSGLTLLIGLLLAGAVVAGCALVASRLTGSEASALPEISIGTCLTSPDLARGRSGLHLLDDVACNRPHDAEVFALRSMQADEDLDRVGERCLLAAADRGIDGITLAPQGLEVRPLALTDSPQPGDRVACFVRHKRGQPLRGAVFPPSE